MTSFCNYFNLGHCRSCTKIGTEYAEQILAKEVRTRSALESFGPFTLEPTVCSPEHGFRNRAKMAVTGTSEVPVIGLTGSESLDLGRDLLECPIHHPKLNEVIKALPAYIREFNLIPYHIAERKGELKGVIAFYSPGPNEMYLRFILRSQECVSRIRKLLPKLQAEFPFITVVTANIQPIPHAILEGPEEIYVTERQTLRYGLGTQVFKLSPRAFVQTNSAVAAELYTKAAEWIGESGAVRMAELFSGQGAFSFFASKHAKQILGIDVNSEGVATANETAKERGLTHLNFICADASRVGAELDAFRPDLVLVNPPRRGLGGAVSLLTEKRPRNLIYSSCSLESLALDMRELSKNYEIIRAQIFDMFPHTEHFETLLLLGTRA